MPLVPERCFSFLSLDVQSDFSTAGSGPTVLGHRTARIHTFFMLLFGTSTVQLCFIRISPINPPLFLAPSLLSWRILSLLTEQPSLPSSLQAFPTTPTQRVQTATVRTPVQADGLCSKRFSRAVGQQGSRC